MFPMNHYQIEERSRQIIGELHAEAAQRRLVRRAREAHEARTAPRGSGRQPGAALRTFLTGPRGALAAALRALAARIDVTARTEAGLA